MKTKANKLYDLLNKYGVNIPRYSNSFASEPHYQKILIAEVGEEGILNGYIEFLLTSGSHSVSICAKTFDDSQEIEELLHDVYDSKERDFKNEKLIKLTNLFIEEMESGQLKNRL